MAKVLNYNKTVIQYFGMGRKSGDVGIEHEIEFDGNLPEAAPAGWQLKGDGSLRNGVEYVTRGPVKHDRVEAVVGSLKSYLDTYNPRLHINMSYRCSTHLHINVQHLTFQEVLSFVALFTLFEKPLVVRYGGDLRRSNNFCMMLSEADWLSNYLRRVYTTDNMRDLQTDAIRYGSINLKAVADYGSVEFRFMRGTVDAGEVNGLASKLIAMREYATGKSPVQIVEDISRKGVEALADELFGKDHDLLAIDLEHSIENLRILQPALYAIDWKPVPKAGELPAVEEEVPAANPENPALGIGPDLWISNFDGNQVREEWRDFKVLNWTDDVRIRRTSRQEYLDRGKRTILWSKVWNGRTWYMVDYLRAEDRGRQLAINPHVAGQF